MQHKLTEKKHSDKLNWSYMVVEKGNNYNKNENSYRTLVTE